MSTTGNQSTGCLTKQQVQSHREFIAKTREANPSFNTKGYKIHPDNPSLPYMG